MRKVFDESGKLVSETPGWLRRSRLVAREFNWLDVREDVYSPSSSSSIVKLLPALAMSDGFCSGAVLGTLDVADAFLQVPQPAEGCQNWQFGAGDSHVPSRTKGCCKAVVPALYKGVGEEVQRDNLR